MFLKHYQEFFCHQIPLFFGSYLKINYGNLAGYFSFIDLILGTQRSYKLNSEERNNLNLYSETDREAVKKCVIIFAFFILKIKYDK